MTTIGRTPIAGTPGDLFSTDNLVSVTAFNDPGNPVALFGNVCKMVNGKVQAIEAGDAAEDFFGILIRHPYTTGDRSTPDYGFGPGTPNPDESLTVLRQGSILVSCPIGTPSRGGTVYMRVQAGAGAIGDLEADPDGANSGLRKRAIVFVMGVIPASITLGIGLWVISLVRRRRS